MSLCDGKARKTRKALALKLNEVREIFEVSDVGFVIVDLAQENERGSSTASEPRVIYPPDKAKKGGELGEVLEVLQRLRNVVSSFGEMLGESCCPVLHISGDRIRFSCYAFGGLFLVFYSAIEEGDISLVDEDREQKMKEICEQLQQLLVNTL